MDFKGLTWVGNIYQKFEAMCLEVEEVMYQDTVKYVEDQVHTVGASVKKFYSDVMQDFLPPSSIDPVKLSPIDLSLNPYGDFCICKKPKASIEADPIKIKKPVTEDSEVVVGAKTDYSPLFSGPDDLDNFHSESYAGPDKRAGMDLYLEQNKCKSSYRHSNGVTKRRSRRNNCVPSGTSMSITPLSKDFSTASSCRERNENGVACDQIAILPCPFPADAKGRDISGAKLCENGPVSTLSMIDASTDRISPVQSDANKQTKLKGSSSDSVPDASLAEDGTQKSTEVVSLIRSNVSEASASEDCLPLPGRSTEFNLKVIDNYENAIGLGIEAVENFDQENLVGTCVLVDRVKLCVATPKEYKPRSYKKKIQKALYSKKSVRKQEYKQLARQQEIESESNQESSGSVVPSLTMDGDRNGSSAPGACESEWELV